MPDYKCAENSWLLRVNYYHKQKSKQDNYVLYLLRLNAVKLRRPFCKKSPVDLPKEVWLIVCFSSQILVQYSPIRYLNFEVIVPNFNENSLNCDKVPE